MPYSLSRPLHVAETDGPSLTTCRRGYGLFLVDAAETDGIGPDGVQEPPPTEFLQTLKPSGFCLSKAPSEGRNLRDPIA